MVFAGCGINFYASTKIQNLFNANKFESHFSAFSFLFSFLLAKYLKKHAKLAILASLACFYYLAFG
jgi:hypothetical protein